MTELYDGPDFYELLQVHPKAELEIIKKAYRTIMAKAHPDQGGDEAFARQVNQAYEVLIDATQRTAYDVARLGRLKARLRAAQADVKAAKSPIVEPTCPILTDLGVLVADERNDRALILAPDGEIVWQYGGHEAPADQRLRRPRHASFTPEGHRLIVDTGANRLIEVRENKTTQWVCDADLNQPIFAQRLPGGETLVAEAGSKQVVLISPEGQRLWHCALQVAPTAAWRLDNGETLISDGRRLLRVSPSGKILAAMPPDSWLGRWRWGRRPWHGANFAMPLGPDAILVASDRIAAIDYQGRYVWTFEGLVEADIRQVYALANGQLLVDFVHLVKRGVNQEVVLLDEGRRPLWRHYYSQHRFM